MAEKTRYPQIPATVWWGVRSILQKTPAVAVDERLLGVQLDVQEVAARQYITELKAAGILNDENKATALAQKWRIDQTYPEAVAELIRTIYPEGLTHVAPPGDSDRQKIVTWFMREGLGEGAAGNKAATYLLISSKEPNEPSTRTGNARIRADRPPAREKRSVRALSEEQETRGGRSGRQNEVRLPAFAAEVMPLNINIQIHIGADAASEQIESIFSAMRRYLYDPQSS